MGQNSTKPVLTLLGHTSRIRSTNFSPDGKLIASASEDNTIRIWDAQNGSPTTKPFKGHTENVNAVTFSADGAYVASCSRDCTIIVWDVRQQKVIVGPLGGHTDWVWSVAFSPEGTQLVSGSKDCSIRIWSAQTGVKIGDPLVGHTDAVYSVAFSPDGARVVSGSRDKTIRIWDVQSRKTVIGPLEGHLDWVCCVSVSSDGKRIASGSRDFTIRVWDAQTGATIAGPFEGHFSPVFSVAFSPDGARIISGGRNGVVYIWEAHTGEILLTLMRGDSGAVSSVAFAPDGKRIVYGCDDGTVVAHAMIDSIIENGSEVAPTSTSAASVAGYMPSKELFEQLVAHGCTDMTSTIDPNGYSADPICAGEFGDIWKGNLADGSEVVVKAWPSSYVTEEDPKRLKHVMEEISAFSKARHENIQELLGVTMFQGRLGMVSHWVPHEYLQEYIREHPEANRYELCIQIATGVSCLHSEDVVHGHLKAANITVSKDGILKLSNCAHSILSETPMVSFHTGKVIRGTVRWMAPELLLSTDDDSEQSVKRTKQTDVYALGMTFLETITGQVPYPGQESDYSVFSALQRHERPERPKELIGDNTKQGTLWKLMLWCWDFEPSSRPGVDYVLIMLKALVGQL
ncbi:Vegetative incompatibility protein HET-E-1 OS=Podospora anserina GN=HET-E1 PE=4 SV=1 [Rhizoctonia solani AG-1 IB]|uniref:Vegetative incompatibility protein HET-E-1 n=1 Tax=Thanatephorus cucumeris (strain AG1-IB / isolate 7/3/14) TaxID=1108050 RepID=A0A0B7FUG9_THACB|nr:Vegetative incompatibility protein HET-E-1 OS=Podospora anserina GN=HET-E1 PE=4 SV=1 [Rhizoctonia solani AG-1 IB]